MLFFYNYFLPSLTCLDAVEFAPVNNSLIIGNIPIITNTQLRIRTRITLPRTEESYSSVIINTSAACDREIDVPASEEYALIIPIK